MRLLALGCAAAAAVWAGPARADLFSPGDLHQKHAHLEGMTGCKACHPRGEELSAQRCLSCHTELGGQVARGKGYHGRLPAADRDACQKCHQDHQGRKQPPTEWGPSGVKGFDHDRAGWRLEKGHAEVKCEDCHRPGLYALPEVLAWVKEHPDCRTYLGAPKRCSACHADEHRGGASDQCERCHHADDWKKTPRYDHVKGSAYPLKGKHKPLKCAACHPTATDEAMPPPGAWPRPYQPRYLKLAPIPHGTCLTCHEDDDVHRGHYGQKCEGCHLEASWKTLKPGALDRIDHDKYRYKLEGAHAEVECAACHGPWPGVLPRPKYKDVPFERCADCHHDAHFGQLDRAQDCEVCHTVASFKAPRYGLKEHERARWPLEGAHLAVACSDCHAEEPALSSRADAKAKAAMRARGRPFTASLARLEFPEKLEACEVCHADPHAGQLEEPCGSCHTRATFRLPGFDHQKTRFLLEGAHQKAACASCHPARQVGGRAVTQYQPLPLECSGCHADAHAGQLGKQVDCARCHGAESFEKAKGFSHAPPFTEYLLEGGHLRVECARCHPQVPVGKGQKVQLFKPLPTSCAGCHADHHQGEFKGFEPAQERAGSQPDQTQCEACHAVAAWSQVVFPHERTGFPLVGGHQAAPCKGCHLAGYQQRVPRGCASCHRDAHAGQLGFGCEKCHDERRWKGAFDADAHRFSNFPLAGRHAAVSCRECHQVARDSTWSRPTSDCIDCHGADYGRTELSGPSHQAAGFGRGCRQCHDTWQFKGARVSP